MRTIPILALACLMLGTSALAAPVRGENSGRLLHDVTYGAPGGIGRLRAALAATADSGFAARGWSALCGASYHFGQYRQAVADCGAAVARDSADAKGDRTTLAMAQLLKDVPPPAAEGQGARTAFDKDRRIPVVAGGVLVKAIADTGAQISVMMQSVAEAGGVRILGASPQVGTTTAPVTGRIGVLPKILLGGAAITNIPVLVLPDAALSFDNGRIQIPFLLGLYVLRPFGRMAWLDHGRMLALGNRAPPPAPGAVAAFWHPLGIGFPLDGPGGEGRAHFDTGANTTNLYAPALEIVSQPERAALVGAEERVGGVGGVVARKVQRLRVANLTLAGHPFVLTNVTVEPADEYGDAARIGDDIFARYESVVLDFDRMRFSVEP